MWKNTDPRLDINKRANIVILRPALEGKNKYIAGTGQVDTKTGWNIFTSFDDYKLIDVDSEWCSLWHWSFTPHNIKV
jgi:hypothetical protein